MNVYTEQLYGLGRKRTLRIADFCTEERKDAALNAVIIGINALNQVFGIGLERLCKLSTEWGNDIIKFYSDGGDGYKDYDSLEAAPAGDLICDIDAEFGDLSDRRRRIIRSYLDEERRNAQWNAAIIGTDTIRRVLKFGDARMQKLTAQWEADLRDFYQDRDIRADQLQELIEQIGFVYENGKLQSYKDPDGKVIKKATAERKMAED